MAEQEQKSVVSNRIQIRSGETKPDASSLLPNELGYQKNTGILYIGREGEPPIPVLPVLVFNDAEGDGNIQIGLLNNS